MPEVARLSVVVTGDTRDLDRSMDKAEKGVQGFAKESEKHAGIASRAFGGITGAFGQIGMAAFGGGVIAEALGAVKDALLSPISAASDLAESVNKTNVVFGQWAAGVHTFAQSSAQNLGIARKDAEEAVGTFGNLFVSMGLGQGEAAGLSTKILTLGADLASFNNIKPEEALEKLRAGLVGESEPLRALGVNLNEASVKAKAMELGLVGADGQISESAKVQARYALILEQTRTAQGDFARTSDGMANASRVAQAAFADIKTVIGEQLLPLVAPLVSAFAKFLPEALAAARPIIEGVGGALRAIATGLGEISRIWATGEGSDLTDALGAWMGIDLDPLIQMIYGLGENFRSLLTAIQEGDIGGAFGIWIDAAKDWARDWLGLLEGIAPKIAAQLKAWGKAFLDWVTPAADQFLAEWPTHLNRFLDWIEDTAAPAIARTLKAWVAAFIDWVTDTESGLFPVVGKIAEVLFRFIVATVAELDKRLLPWAAAFLGWIVTDVLPFLAEQLGKILVRIGEWIATDAVPWAAKAFVELGRAIVKGIVDGILSVPNAIGDAIGKVTPKVPGAPQLPPLPGGGGGGGTTGPLPGGITIVPARDQGGFGRAGQAYAIGTGAQPELFVPQSAGTFVPSGSWQQPIAVTVPISIDGMQFATVNTVARQRYADRGGRPPPSWAR